MFRRAIRVPCLLPALAAAAVVMMSAAPAHAADTTYFSAVDNVTNQLVQRINAETVRIDMSCWYLTEHSISIALLNKFQSGVPVRLIGDRGSIFEIDPLTKREFYWLASYGVPIRLRYNPTWYPEIDHWKATVFVGQNLVAFGSGNYTPFELAPVSTTNYKDELFLFTDDAALVGAFETRFDTYWNDTTPEAESLVRTPPYFKDWNDACALESACADYATQYPNREPMVIDTARLAPDNPMPPDLIWGQGPAFNNRLVQEIDNENVAIDFVIYRLTVDSITDALLAKFRAGVPMRLIIEPNEYLNRKWPEFWLTHANVDKLWAAGVPIEQRLHDGLTHMKVLITSTYTTIASSNYAAAWQRDHDYFVSRAAKPGVYTAVQHRFDAMWADTAGFAPFSPQPPDTPTLSTPTASATGVATTTSLVWNTAPFAVSYEVYLGTSQANMTLAGNVPAVMNNNPPGTYSFTPAAPLQSGVSYFWKVVSRTNATSANAAMAASSSIASFTTAGTAGPAAAAVNPTPSDGASGVGSTPTLGWSAGAVGATYAVSLGTTNPPPQVATGLTSPSYAPGVLASSTLYYWSVTTVTSGGSTAGPVWSFTTGSGSNTAPTDIVLYASDVTSLHGTWTTASDPTAAGGLKLTNPDNGAGALAAPLAAPANYFDATFQAQSGVRYRVWFRVHPVADSKFNDSVFVQFSDGVTQTGTPQYRIGTTGAYILNLWECATCQTSGWGWQRNAYWLADSGDVWFQNTGAHTIRVQIREDGSEIDQIVISPATYANSAPGAASADSTIVPKPSVVQPASIPGSPAPADGATGVSPAAALGWTSANATSYDVYFGTANPPPLVVSGTTSATYQPTMANATTYFWKVVARNSGGMSAGPLWSFVTAALPPGTPGSPTPADTATGVSTGVVLTWSATAASSYDVLLGTSDPPSQVATGLTAGSYTPGGLAADTTYFWQVVAHNSGGANQGPVWRFTTAAPRPPAAPGSPAPADAATGVSTTATLSWSASGATSYDLAFGTTNPPSTVATGLSTASYSPSGLTNATTYYWQIVAHNAAGTTTGAVWSFTTAAAAIGNVVIYASDIPAAALHGLWQAAPDGSSPNGMKLVTADMGWAQTNAPLASPANYVDVTFTADAGKPYTLWLRMQALNNNKYNDSVWIQFSDALANGGGAVYALGTSAGLNVNLATDAAAGSLNGWGWQNTAYWVSQPVTVTFGGAGTHTMRIQVREDGVQLDQIVLSSTTYATAAPGPVGGDATVVARP